MDETYWRQNAGLPQGRPCLFLDRDGVIVEDVHYLGRAEDVRMVPGIAMLIAAARSAGYAVGVVTNQSGIGRGYFGWPAFLSVQERIDALLAVDGQHFDFVAACSALPAALRAAGEDHPWRKPNPGMLLHAAKALCIDLARSAIVGDQVTDLEAGAAAGLGTLIYVETSRSEAAAPALGDFRAHRNGTHIVQTVADAADLLAAGRNV